MTSSRSVGPAEDQLEISILGPGRGECVVLHLGKNQWAVVDSCVERGGRSVAIDYLEEIGHLSPASIRLVVATHWHDDHIRGLSSVLHASPEAVFSCSAALRAESFYDLVAISEDPLAQDTGVDEFGALLRQLLARKAADVPSSMVTPRWAIAQRALFENIGLDQPFPVSVIALSPADGLVTKAFQAFAAQQPKAGDVSRTVVNKSPNAFSTALWIKAGPVRAVLGADLEHSSLPGEGWLAAIETHTDPLRADLVKVPHHGSVGADCERAWEALLARAPCAIMTPFRSSGLPRERDVRRWLDRTEKVYVTAQSKQAPPRREQGVDRLIKETVRSRRPVAGKVGHVRVRWHLSATTAGVPTVELFNGAAVAQVSGR